MTYDLTDLTVFTPLLEPENREGTNYIELFPKELPEPNACWLKGSFLLKDAAFDFYTECFYRSDPDFDYFAFQKLDFNEIQTLTSDLSNFLESIRTEPTKKQLFSRYASIFNQDIWDDIPIETLSKVVLSCGDQLLKFISKETSESRILWVLGM